MNEYRVICDDLYLEKIHIATVVFFPTTSLFFPKSNKILTTAIPGIQSITRQLNKIPPAKCRMLI